MANYYLSDIDPDQRDAFLTIMAFNGIEGEARPTKEPISRVPSNLYYTTDFTMRAAYEDRLVSSDPLWTDVLATATGRAKTKYTSLSVEYDVLPWLQGVRDNKITSMGKRRVLHANYSRVIHLSDLIDDVSAWAWLADKAGSGDRGNRAEDRYVYIHGVLIEGIHFNHERRADAEALFVDMTPPRPVIPATITPSGKAKFKTPPRPGVAEEQATAERLARIRERNRYGYVKVGRFIFTSFAHHAEWRASPVAVNGEPEDAMVKAWRSTILEKFSKERRTIDNEIEVLAKKRIEAERRLGQLRMLLGVATSGTDEAIQRNIDQIKAIPEIESFTPRYNGFTIITADMIATKESDQTQRYCGKFEIQVDLGGRVRMRNIASPHKNYRNPHDDCVGSFDRVFSSALNNFDYYSVILAAMEYYRFFDTNHESNWDYLPDSLKPPKEVHVSDWHEIIGAWISTKEGTPIDPLEAEWRAADRTTDDEEDDEEADEDEDY